MNNEFTHTVTEETSYYTDSPQQGRPADGSLGRGDKIKLLKGDANYSRVELEDGKTVYVASQDLTPIVSGTGGNEKSDERPSMSATSREHLDEVELKYGGQMMHLSKSNKFIAIKPRTEIEPGALSELLPEVSGADTSSRLGGFQLVSVENSSESVEEKLDTLRANSAVKTGTHVYQTSEDEVPFVPTGQIYIECEPGSSIEDCQKLLEDNSLEIVEARSDRTIIAQTTPQSENPVKVAKTLQDSPLIAVAEPDLATPGKIHNFAIPTDDRIVDQWHLRNTGAHRGTSLGFLAGADARVMEAWETAQTIGSPNVVVAVIDDGFDLLHPDLTGTWKIVAPKDFTRNTTDPVPDLVGQDWHGTACAGVALGNADGTGIVGAAPPLQADAG